MLALEDQIDALPAIAAIDAGTTASRKALESDVRHLLQQVLAEQFEIMRRG